ncbi:ankyrin repeat-containing domain protein [Cladorrhinum sp. PSN259]|nr:ankyrin repeat-containing domain protein [Cladorrhinum sp. PSN259]
MGKAPLLPGLPTELITIIAECLYEPDASYHAWNKPDHLDLSALRSLASFARTNRRLSEVAGLVLYRAGLKDFAHLPLAWGAKKGVPGTVKKALDAGADPNFEFSYTLKESVWMKAQEFLEGIANWDSKSPDYWPTGELRISQIYRISGRASPTFTHLDVYAPVLRSVIISRAARRAAHVQSVLRSDGLIPLNDTNASDTNPTTITHATHNTDSMENMIGTGSMDGMNDTDDTGDTDDMHDTDDMDDMGLDFGFGYFDDGDEDDDDIDEDDGFGPWDDETDDSDVEDERDCLITRKHTALHIATKEGHTSIVHMLLDHQAHIGSESLFFCGCPPQVSLWQKVEDPDFELHGTPRWTPLHVAICSHRLEIAKLLIFRGADILSPETRPDFPPIHQAAANGHVDLLTYMLETNPHVGVDSKDECGLTPLYYAVVNRRWESTVPFLLGRGANIDLGIDFKVGRGEMSTTMLAEACRFGRFEDAMRLLDVGANIDCHFAIRPREDYRQSALAIHATTIPLLHLCCMQTIFMPPGPNQYREELCFPGRGQEVVGPKLIARIVANQGLEPWRCDDDDERTALSVAVVHLKSTAVQALLNVGADVNACDTKNRNALMVLLGEMPREPEIWTAVAGHWRRGNLSSDVPEKLILDIVHMLLNAGVRVNHQDRDGKTVLHLFFEAFDTRSINIDNNLGGDILRLLLANGADPLIKDNKGLSAFHPAIRGMHPWAMNILTRHSRVELVDLFDYEEIIEVLGRLLVHANAYLGASADAQPGRPRSQMREFTDLLLDLDHSGHFLSDIRLFQHFLGNMPTPNRRLAHSLLAEAICLRALPYIAKGLEPKSVLAFIRQAVANECFRLTLQLARLLPPSMINEVDDDGETILFKAMQCSPLDRYQGFEAQVDFQTTILDLLRLGANLHQSVSTKKEYPNLSGTSITPLMLAITRPVTGWEILIPAMLGIQPIKRNPQASSQLYLHKILDPDVLGSLKTAGSFRTPGSDGCTNLVVHSLLRAGADKNQVDEDGNTPLSFFLEHKLKNLWGGHVNVSSCQFILPLSLGADLTIKNRRGISVMQLLAAFQKRLPKYSPEFSPHTFRIVKLENGEREIRWNKKYLV